MESDDNFWTYFFATMTIVLSVLFIGITFEKYSVSQVKIACYEAAKTNQNIKCDQEK